MGSMRSASVLALLVALVASGCGASSLADSETATEAKAAAVATTEAVVETTAAEPEPEPVEVERQTFTYAVMATALREAATRHGWLRTTHEHLCVDSVMRFRELATRLGLEWGDEAARFVEASDREGSGYRTERRTADQPERWRHRLTDEQVERILATLERFPTLERPAV